MSLRARSSTFTRGSRRSFRATLERLEPRLPLSLSIEFDYSYDELGFFTANPDARRVLEEAAAIIGGRITDNLAAIVPDGSRGRTWSEVFRNPSTGARTTVDDPSIPADSIVVYAAGFTNSGFAGEGGPGGFSARGDQAWNSLVATRGAGGAAGTWGGTISFDAATRWSFAGSTEAPDPKRYDFLSVALHELGHVLGIGTTDAWRGRVDAAAGAFTGPHTEAVVGGPAPLNGPTDVPGEPADTHWAAGLQYHGQTPAVDVAPLKIGERRSFTAIDWAGLRDLGWSIDQAVVTVQPPSLIPAWVDFGLTVAVVAPDGSLDADYQGAVTLELAPNSFGARLLGELTVRAVDGVAAFSGLMLDRGGVGFQIRVNGDGVGSTAAASINVVSATGAPLPRSTSTAGAPGSGGAVGTTPVEVVAVAPRYARGGRRRLVALDVHFSAAVESPGMFRSSNYTLLKGVKRGKRTVWKRVRFRVAAGGRGEVVRLLVRGNQSFGRGGRLIVHSDGPNGDYPFAGPTAALPLGRAPRTGRV